MRRMLYLLLLCNMVLVYFGMFTPVTFWVMESVLLLLYAKQHDKEKEKKEVLRRYMKHVKEQAGTTYCTQLNTGVKFSQTEVKDLLQTAIECCDEKFYAYE